MTERSIEEMSLGGGREVRRDSFRDLIRRPFVQLVLTVALIGQITAIGVAAESNGARAGQLILSPVVVSQPQSGVQKAWLARTILRESERLGAEYRTKGFSVPPQLARQIGEAAAEYDIDPRIAFGLVRAESSFRNAATSPVGAIGLTQLMPRTASWVEPGITRAQLRDPETNLRVGFKYLRYLLDKYEGDEKLALIAYNRGPGTVDNALKRGRNPDNGYADFVEGKANHSHRLFTR